MNWFKRLTGISERSPDDVRRQIAVEGDCLVFPNGQRSPFGRLEIPTLGDLRERAGSLDRFSGRLTIDEVVADVQDLHCDPKNENALFQVASQFNLLEMTGPEVTPEEGVGLYAFDRTQGPACAIACGAATIYRNYLVPVDGELGQTVDRQIDCACDVGKELGNDAGQLWSMTNGYLLPTPTGLEQITAQLRSAPAERLDMIRSSLRIGLQWNAAVTLGDCRHRVSQAFCSALPVSYGNAETDQWADFARLVLEAAYEATFCAAVLNFAENGNDRLYLTLLGGGAFGNPVPWILDAIERSTRIFQDIPLQVSIVSYSRSRPEVVELATRVAKL